MHNWWAGDASTARGAKYTCGTLQYTPVTLMVLFGWLLWGDFTFTLMESMPSLLVMQLKDYAVSNQTMAVLLTTIATVCNIINAALLP